MKAVINFGRLNPPTIGHRKMAKQMDDLAIKLDADAILLLSSSCDPKKNPLPFDNKVKFVEDMINDLDNTTVSKDQAANLYQALSIIYKMGYKVCYLFGGSDRVKEFQTAKKYNDIKEFNDRLKENEYFKFDKLEIELAGQRDDNSLDKTEQASASLLRQCVKDLDYERFAQYAGTQTLTEEMFEDVAYYMGISLSD